MRYHVATRSRDGEIAFVHTSIREYVYQRLSSERRRELHMRAASWYRGKTDPVEARHHEGLARPGRPRPAARGRGTGSPR